MHGSNELFLKSVFVKSRFRALDLHCCVSFVMSLSISGVKFICHSTLTQCMFCFDLTSQRIPTRTNACAIDWNDECYNHGSDEHTLSLSISYLSCSSQNTHKKKKPQSWHSRISFHLLSGRAAPLQEPSHAQNNSFNSNLRKSTFTVTIYAEKAKIKKQQQ